MKVLIAGMVPPSLNEIRGRYKNHFAYRDLRLSWERAILVSTGGSPAAKLFREQSKANSKTRLVITVHRARELDYDNGLGGLKPVIDALRALKFIADDDPKHLAPVDLRTVVTGAKGKKLTEIEIEPA